VYICAYLRILASNASVLMAESVERELEVHRTDDEPVKKQPKLMYNFFDKFDPNDPAQVASRLAREQREVERERVRCVETERNKAEQLLRQTETRKASAAKKKREERANKKAELQAAKALVRDAVKLSPPADMPDEEQASDNNTELPGRKKLGRPKGSKNTSKLAVLELAVQLHTFVAEPSCSFTPVFCVPGSDVAPIPMV
jgi:hypothetical protein